jgi:hypothetical protein
MECKTWDAPPKWLKVETQDDHMLLWKDTHEFIEHHDNGVDEMKDEIEKLKEEKATLAGQITALESNRIQDLGLDLCCSLQMDHMSNQLWSLQLLITSILVPVV